MSAPGYARAIAGNRIVRLLLHRLAGSLLVLLASVTIAFMPCTSCPATR